ncbi:DUF1642 domain-containing protein [Enterococcus durans]|uniref:DUF1642 domain-containing protein n=1 Tax=Enterococcus durans TaxID=53345 RepID=UPI0010205D6E|nr:DUF1642 domain-containing protein [Enterococcus durans]MZG91089.1 DUF1642 domain-containing protein [Enterococcus durans]MZG93358.1 DUF1642 domain-containing protein [Enterococcus durans]MZH20765.1 DUF1642 domain-containing protein [Enterococcus durans]MZH23498.1 DUF1642 domain-containing protein [Enterococcus durans]MZH26211.1 DUF1642 domain-containing protein [Enterococcus durans]
MNKQELINELAKYVKRYENATDDYSQGRYGAYKVSLKLAKRLNEQNITDKQAWDKVAEAYPESAQSLRNTLDNAVFGKTGEPQKHVMPKFFDKWAKQVLEKRNKFYAISLITRAGWGYGVDYELNYDRVPSGTKELLNWIVENEGDDYPNKKKAVEALLHGYEVEKEPLYSVIIAGDYLVKEISCSNEVKLISTAYLPQYLAHHYQLTEKQIKAIDERFWPFAVPVEEE